MAKILVGSAVSYINNTRETTLKIIDLVVFEPSMVDEFVKSMEVAVRISREKSKGKGWTTRISEWITDKIQLLLGSKYCICDLLQ